MTQPSCSSESAFVVVSREAAGGQLSAASQPLLKLRLHHVSAQMFLVFSTPGSSRYT